MEAIDCHVDGAVAVFMVAGEVMCTPSKSKSFDNNVARLGCNLVGVYDCGADHRCVREDLGVFYQ